MLCNHCGKETFNPKYCSRSCSAKVSNRIKPKRKPEGNCANCNLPIRTIQKYCLDCKHKFGQEKYKSMTIGEYRNRLSLRNKHPSWLHSHIRMFARSWNKELLKLPCESCGYNLHIEVCHIKPISSFTDNTVLSIVNGRSNIKILCRNCHWEFDNGHLDL